VAAPASASPELTAGPRRRTFTARDKLRILAETGGIGAVLRREGVYSSTLCDWRRQRDAGAFGALTPVKRGPRTALPNPHLAEVASLQKDNAHLTRRLARAEAIIVVQKNLCGRPRKWQALLTLPKRLIPSRPGPPDRMNRRRHVNQLLGFVAEVKPHSREAGRRRRRA
jgi:transposase